MDLVERSALVAHRAATMYALVENVEAYPQFLPWCRAAEVRLRDTERTVATIHIDYRGVRQSFTTENAKQPDAAIAMRLVEGPFRKLEGLWQFHALAEDASKVELRLAYQLASPVLARLVGPVFEGIANSMVDAFVRRADAIHAGP
ncbi:MAG: type II toxin-antitoxin system RatA family toxin [Burkholderiales bacterium]|jgi:ribosome-associated toxin RatA of RatAB toxin-antitoxin module|nr:type II toxin-antitoxin system RatA family toxin [Burkholderiales bacterium]